ncbi:MAG: hypothetical protein RMH77_04450 [Sulfolobales archaeon]|nr:hypothetical protein [Sulfolobales archaeon]MCX8185693.1 hypothetical protein [Sulfolobales archaeon]MDW7969636.1 hypothetical protein [Sulfolobales archaeon]
MTKQSFEDKILNMVKKGGEDGVVQSDLWNVLGIDSREGSRAVNKLVRSGLIKRVPTTSKGRRTYKLIYVSKKSESVKLLVKLNPAMSIPCFLCKDLEKCGLGSYFNPLICGRLTKFLQIND